MYVVSLSSFYGFWYTLTVCFRVTPHPVSLHWRLPVECSILVTQRVRRSYRTNAPSSRS